MIAHILNNLPADDEHLCASLRSNIGTLTLPQVHSQVRKFYKDLTKRSTAATDYEGDKALMARQFKDCCNNCGRFKHRTRDFRVCKSTAPTAQGNSNNKPKASSKNKGKPKWEHGPKTTTACTHCGKIGHTTELFHTQKGA